MQKKHSDLQNAQKSIKFDLAASKLYKLEVYIPSLSNSKAL